MKTTWRTKGRVVATVWGAGVLLLVLTACGAAGPVDPLDKITDSLGPADALAADSLVLLLSEIAHEYAAGDDAATIIAAGTTPTGAQEQLAAQLPLSNQAKAFVRAQAQYEGQRWSTAERPEAVEVEAISVRSAQGPNSTPTTLVAVETTYSFADGVPDTVTSVDYAVQWSTVDAATAGADGKVKLDAILPVYADGGGQGLDSAAGRQSTRGTVTEYLSALTSGDSKKIDSYEGGVNSSPDLRAALRTRLAQEGRITLVEVPAAQTGSRRTVYGVLPGEGTVPRFDVETSGDEPVVDAYLQ